MISILEAAIIKFNEDEITTKISDEISTYDLIKKHKEALKCLEAINTFKERKQHKIDSIHGFPGTFHRLRAGLIKRIDTIHRCINRLTLRHNKIVNELLNQKDK